MNAWIHLAPLHVAVWCATRHYFAFAKTHGIRCRKPVHKESASGEYASVCDGKAHLTMSTEESGAESVRALSTSSLGSLLPATRGPFVNKA
mmetsp:Transcript_22300/g.67817  ORF Transcript_22300/g.67817 Transcript_22300/m.67817 type:complete len:91 (+) Transcript_22300:127-399(+)|eukprot:scaffold287451_cov30-Tisochrysis_lutea.AAC.1